MRIDIVCFTDLGLRLGRRLEGLLSRTGDQVQLERCGAGGRGLRDWLDACFDRADALVFIGAVGIAVRAVAPKIVGKNSDPAVVVMDEAGTWAISLLSGHLGGANDLAHRLARETGAVPVVTTATDARGVFAVDSYARRTGMHIENPERIKSVSATLLAGCTVRLASPFPVDGPLPAGIEQTEGEADLVVGYRPPERGNVLVLVPSVLVLGVGCRRGVVVEVIDECFMSLCRERQLYPSAFGLVCSIDRKRDEPGLVAFCRARGLPYQTFAAADLAALPGEFTASVFVNAVAGVDNVCERCAVAGSGGSLVVGKTVRNGVTMAVAVRDYRLTFGNGGGQA